MIDQRCGLVDGLVIGTIGDVLLSLQAWCVMSFVAMWKCEVKSEAARWFGIKLYALDSSYV